MTQTLHEEVEALFGELSTAELDGFTVIEHAVLYHTERWDTYEVERKAERERNPAFAARERERWARANGRRKVKRRGHHLSNAQRLRAASDIREGRKTADEVARETGCSVATAERIGQLVLWEVA